MTTRTTTHLRLATARAATWLDRLALPPALIVAVLVFVVAGAISALGQLQSAAVAAAVPTPALPFSIVVTATPAAVETQDVASLQPGTFRRAVVAYDSPGGAVIGAVEQGRAYVVLARYGSDWLQAEVSGSGVVWLRADQVLDLPADLADLAPTPAPQLVYVASQPAPAVATIAPPAATDPPAPAELDAAAAAEREQNIRDRLHANGGSGKMEAPTFPTMPAASDSAAQWCAGAAKSGVARCGP